MVWAKFWSLRTEFESARFSKDQSEAKTWVYGYLLKTSRVAASVRNVRIVRG